MAKGSMKGAAIPQRKKMAMGGKANAKNPPKTAMPFKKGGMVKAKKGKC